LSTRTTLLLPLSTIQIPKRIWYSDNGTGTSFQKETRNKVFEVKTSGHRRRGGRTETVVHTLRDNVAVVEVQEADVCNFPAPTSANRPIDVSYTKKFVIHFP
jgi:hypothetical protein